MSSEIFNIKIMNQPFSFSKPQLNNDKKQSGFSSIIEKISAIIGLIEGLGGIGIQAKAQKPLTPKERKRIARIIIFGLIWFIGAGAYQTIHLIIELINFF